MKKKIKMKQVITETAYGGQLVPIKAWLNDIEESALRQAVNLANLPFVFKHVALMPDAHAGYGMPIGGVLATCGVVIPNAVGVDIGCGMRVLKTDIPVAEMTVELRKAIMSKIREVIPLGMNHHETRQDMSKEIELHSAVAEVVEREYESAHYQIGTLGGGNHFIEIQAGDDGYVYVMIHSGSRNLGKRIADHYNKIAMSLNEKWYSSVTPNMQLAFLPIDDPYGKAYMHEMDFAVRFAKYNRKLMMDRIADILLDLRHSTGFLQICDSGVPVLDVPHNYARLENHYNTNVMVHRKGATKAADGGYGIIPGSQGTSSYIVIGKGNPESFESCSHGAGRLMGRNEARRTLDLQKEIERLDSQGIVHSVRSEHDLDEAAGAYKNIDVVMENQKDLVDIAVKLKPLAVIKADEKPRNRKKNSEDMS